MFKLEQKKRSIRSLFSPRGEIYEVVYIGRQPEREICGEKKHLQIQWVKKDT